MYRVAWWKPKKKLFDRLFPPKLELSPQKKFSFEAFFAARH
jgi:hypothetical protein